MFSKIYAYEIKYWLKSPSSYVYFLAFFGISFISFAGTAGFFDPPPESNKTERFLNAPYEINFILLYFNKVFLFLLPTIIGATIYKDYKNKVYSVLYSFPIKKLDYLLGKFLSAFTIVVLTTSSVALGMVIGEHLPNLHPGKIGPFNSMGYLQAYIVYIIPNMFIYGLIVFSITIWFRNIYTGFAVIILLLLLQSIAENALGGNGFLVALFDPFGQNTSAYVTQFWTLAEQNAQIIPVSSLVIYNRLLWVGFAALIFIFTCQQFSFSEYAIALKFKKFRRSKSAKETSHHNSIKSIPIVTYNFSFQQQLKTIWHLSILDFKYIIKKWMFISIALLGGMAIFFSLSKVTNNSEMTLLPVTGIVLSIPAFFFTGIILLLTFIYSGMVIHREKNSGMSQLADATPLPAWIFLLSKTLAIIKMQGILLFAMMLSGIAIQLYNGYYHLEIGLYIFHLFIVTYPALIIWTFAATFIHGVFSNTYMGIFFLTIGWLGINALPQAGIHTNTLAFNALPQISYSDLNAYRGQLRPYFYTKAYWFIFGLLLLFSAYLLWPRGLTQSFREKFLIANQRFKQPIRITVCILLTLFITLGVDIYIEEQKTFEFSNKEKAFNDFEKNYRLYSGITQPKITSVKIALDIYPESNQFNATGAYTLVNKSPNTIDTLLIKTGFDEITKIKISQPAEMVSIDTFVQFSVLKLSKGLAPGDSLILKFNIKNKPNHFFEKNSNVLHNGTFLKQDIFPRLGYFLDSVKSPEDPQASNNNYQAIDADLIDFEAIISTSKNQMAIAPGYLQKEWTEKGRRYFKYKTTQKIKYAFGFNSGRFKTRQDQWKNIGLEVYYHPEHDYNLDKMMAGLKAALAYNTHYFGPYQHQQARIVEFPKTEGSFATTYANNIPISEIRFIANSEAPKEKIDLSFYVPTHELTHQWWGNQVIPANALGAVMLTESITEYITLKIYKQHYGNEQALKFLNLQRQRYLRGRTTEQEEEPPLIFVTAEQQYLAYGKGTIAFNTLSHYLGEDKLNGILKLFLEDYKFQGPPYPTSIELVTRLKKATPDSLQYLINDLFESVTFYDNKLKKAELGTLKNGQYKLDLSFSIQKSNIEPGNSEAIPSKLSDYIQIGIYDANGVVIYLKDHKITQVENQLSIVLPKRASKVVLDPNTLLIDKDLSDNTMDVE